MAMKEKILLKAEKEFLTKGIREMSVQSLVVPLGISTKTFYKYFKNKEELLEEVLTLHYNQQFEIIKKYSSEQNPVHILLHIWRQAFHKDNDVNNKFYSDLHYYYPKLEARVEAKVGIDFWLEFKKVIQKGIDEGLFIRDILPAVVMESISVLYSSSVRTDQFEKFNISSNIAYMHTVALIIRGDSPRPAA